MRIIRTINIGCFINKSTLIHYPYNILVTIRNRSIKKDVKALFDNYI